MTWIDNAKCNECEECIFICPNNAINFVENKLIIDRMKCKQCYVCINVCSVGAIKKQKGGEKMNIKIIILFALIIFSSVVFAYPPAVGILGKAKNCLVCHVNNGPWRDDNKTIIDIIDKDTKKSFRQSDGSFLIEVKRNDSKTILTVIGRTKEDTDEIPYRNAWIYIDSNTIESTSLSKFASGWDANLPMSCRLVGDKLEGYEGAKITVLPISISPSGSASDSDLVLQCMLTKGESVKGRPKEGMIGNYFERKVKLKVSK